LASSICALASAVSRAAIEGLDRRMAPVPRHRHDVKADCAGFAALRADAMVDCLASSGIRPLRSRSAPQSGLKSAQTGPRSNGLEPLEHC
jgi:hypothetical protein